MSGVRVLAITADGVEGHAIADVAALLLRPEVLIWVDIPECGDEVVTLLTDVLGLHPLAVRDCLQRNRVPRVRIYPHEQLLILHGPERGPSGHVHYIELDQIIGERYVVTVHGPINPAVDPEVALRETSAVRRRIESGRRTMGALCAEVTIAAERLAVIAVVTLPITALSSIYGMNIIVNDRTHVGALAGVLTVMVVMSALLLTWAKRRGWW